eukprot:TRINITY_DN32820_c0_g1_i1.p1 TRINITY_DN32820_c0_g1~~TRINITY_DN32820_c0_g1_i1.p1  ORF type:complete len:891 (-),score=143.12 TRINITY_DN32820_c0_g1_i1:188-2830(-)
MARHRDASWATTKRIEKVFQLGSRKAPYPHQVEGVNKLLRAIQDGHQKRFLHYYAPRTGKTLVQAAIAYWLLRLRRELSFSLVVVINDREVLDSQSYDVVEEFIEHLKSAPAPWGLPQETRILQADSAKQLSDEIRLCEHNLHAGKDVPTILFTTFQKFNGDDLASTRASPALSDRTLVMPDEVHRSHTEFGSLTTAMERVLGASYFVALTGTPNRQALERFGTRCSDGLLRPFHCYHLGRAVSEGLVMDPRIEFNEVASIIDGLDESRTAGISLADKAKLQKLICSSPASDVLNAKVQLLVDHFVSSSAALSYQAQGMVLCSSREEVLRATRAARATLAQHPDWRCSVRDVLGAFSGTVSGESERDLNGLFLRSAADAKRARLLFVAHKFETGYDNADLTFMYVMRKIDANTLATQACLRHCGKRAGKIRPVTLDFANQDGQLLSYMSLFFGEVACQPSGAVITDPASEQQAARPMAQSSSRRRVQEHLLQRLRLSSLEVRPVATPCRPLPQGTILRVAQSRHPRLPSSSEGSSVADTHHDVLVLKVLPKGQTLGQVERDALGRLSLKASQGHASVLKAMSGCNTPAAMRNVLMNGNTAERSQAMEVLAMLKHVDAEAAKLCELLDCLEAVAEKSACDVFQALKRMKHLHEEDNQLFQVASSLGACQLLLKSLTKLSSDPLKFGWQILELLSPHDAAAFFACALQRDFAELHTVYDRLHGDDRVVALLHRLIGSMASASSALLSTLHQQGAVRSLHRVLAYGSRQQAVLAKSLSKCFAKVSSEATHVLSLLGNISYLATTTRFEPDPAPVLEELLRIVSLPQDVSLDAIIVRRFGLQWAVEHAAKYLHGRSADLAKAVVASLEAEAEPACKRARHIEAA